MHFYGPIRGTWYQIRTYNHFSRKSSDQLFISVLMLLKSLIQTWYQNFRICNWQYKRIRGSSNRTVFGTQKKPFFKQFYIWDFKHVHIALYSIRVSTNSGGNNMFFPREEIEHWLDEMHDFIPDRNDWEVWLATKIGCGKGLVTFIF